MNRKGAKAQNKPFRSNESLCGEPGKVAGCLLLVACCSLLVASWFKVWKFDKVEKFRGLKV